MLFDNQRFDVFYGVVDDEVDEVLPGGEIGGVEAAGVAGGGGAANVGAADGGELQLHGGVCGSLVLNHELARCGVGRDGGDAERADGRQHVVVAEGIAVVHGQFTALRIYP